MKKLEKRLNELIDKVRSDEFYNNRGLANEIPFYIFDYLPEVELKIRSFIKNKFLKKLNEESKLNAVEIDLFELLIESMEKDQILKTAFQMEEKKGTKVLFENLKKSFNIEIILKYIKTKSKDKNLILLTGVGKVYPIIRTHTVLNNLQNVLDENTKVILFFPGEYTTTDLKLFGLFKDNNYYRAFKL